MKQLILLCLAVLSYKTVEGVQQCDCKEWAKCLGDYEDGILAQEKAIEAKCMDRYLKTGAPELYKALKKCEVESSSTKECEVFNSCKTSAGGFSLPPTPDVQKRRKKRSATRPERPANVADVVQQDPAYDTVQREYQACLKKAKVELIDKIRKEQGDESYQSCNEKFPTCTRDWDKVQSAQKTCSAGRTSDDSCECVAKELGLKCEKVALDTSNGPQRAASSGVNARQNKNGKKRKYGYDGVNHKKFTKNDYKPKGGAGKRRRKK